MSETWNSTLPRVLGSFDPLRNLIWTIYDGETDPYAVTFNHEYNHLIGTVGRHLQICLLYYCLRSRERCVDIVARERGIVESFVPVWLSEPSRSTEPMSVATAAPESDPAIVQAIKAICSGLASCTWIMDSAETALTFEQVLRAVQQAVLNLAQGDELYSPNASRLGLECLTSFATQVAGRKFMINRVSRGEYHALEYGPSRARPTAPPRLGTCEHGEMLELLLVNVLEDAKLKSRRYTLHERAQFVLDWFRLLPAQQLSSTDVVEYLAAIASVFAPRAFLPLAAFYRVSPQQFRGELHALPFSRPARMPVLQGTI